jgi:hypothetical protein
MSLLTICQNAADDIGFPAPATIINNSDQNAKQLLRLANREGHALSKATDWQALKREATITLLTADQDYALPADFGWIIPTTTWNRSTNRYVLNPLTSTEWQLSKGLESTGGLNLRARIIGNQVVFDQTITSAENNQTVIYEYISSYWAQSSGLVAAAAWAADTDTARLSEELITLGIIWRFKKSKGLDDWEVDQKEYRNQKDKIIARDGGMRKLCFGGGEGDGMGVNVPDAGYG